jgi:hypothetical protein
MVRLLLKCIALLRAIVVVGELGLIVMVCLTLAPVVGCVLVKRVVCKSTLWCHFNSQYGLFTRHETLLWRRQCSRNSLQRKKRNQ